MIVPRKILTVFGTRPEVIKLAPVIREIEAYPTVFTSINVTSAQHTDLLYPFIQLFRIRIDHDMKVMEPNQSLNQVCSRVLSAFDPILEKTQPDLILVQGDTTTAMAASLAGFHRRIPVGHVEAGLRSGDIYSPYPEEMNRRLVTRLASYHFASTTQNVSTLLAEGVDPEQVFLTGNPVVDSLQAILQESTPSHEVEDLLAATEGSKRIILTTHRRESFGEILTGNLRVLREFVEAHGDVMILFPAHPNPSVREPAYACLNGHPRIRIIPPLQYHDFVLLLSHAWLIVSDSGGVQEEAPTLGKPLLILRENTERPEAVECGVARLVGKQPARLKVMLEESYMDGSWIGGVKKITNPFGDGYSSRRIVQVIAKKLDVPLAITDPVRRWPDRTSGL